MMTPATKLIKTKVIIDRIPSRGNPTTPSLMFSAHQNQSLNHQLVLEEAIELLALKALRPTSNLETEWDRF